MTSKITEEIVDMLRSRSDVGLKKYGTSMDRTDLTHADWCQHAIEELLDGAQYLLRVKEQTPVPQISLATYLEVLQSEGLARGLQSVKEANNYIRIYDTLVKHGYLNGVDEDDE